jgi:hypothetical protein
MANTDLAVRIATILDASGLKKADKGIAKLQKSVRSLNLGFAVSAAGAAAFAKASISAFIADEAAASKLSLAVKNLGMEFANPYIANYISDMEKMTKVADDELRPAFQSLLQQTGSLSASQSALSTAIEVSRGSGIALSTVTNDLAMAYVGNVKGLKKYYLGLSNASLQAKSFTEIQKIMNDQFTGSSAAYLNTYSGQVGVLSLAWGNFQEKVGGTLLTLASFGDGSEGAKLNVLAETLNLIGSAIETIGKGKEAIAGLFNITGQNGLLSGFNPYRTPSSTKEDKAANPMDKYAKQLAKIEADRKKQNLAIVAAQKKLTAEQKKQALLKKQSALFDLEQIQIIAALKGNISQEERTRLELQLAVIQGNDKEADRLSQKLANTIDSTGKLALSLRTLPDANNPFKSWDAFLDSIIAKARLAASIGGMSPAAVNPPPTNVGGLNVSFGASTNGVSSAANGDIIVNVSGSVISEDDLIAKIRAGIQSGSLSGKPADIGRLAGMFG